MKKLYRFLKLPRSDQKLFLQAYILMMLVRLGLLLLPFQKLQDLILKTNELRFLGEANHDVGAKDIALSVIRSAKLSPGGVKCLAKALTASMLMKTYGLPYKTNIGVAKGEKNNLEAHAWVESEGKIVVGYLPDLSRYVAMSSAGKGLIL